MFLEVQSSWFQVVFFSSYLRWRRSFSIWSSSAFLSSFSLSFVSFTVLKLLYWCIIFLYFSFMFAGLIFKIFLIWPFSKISSWNLLFKLFSSSKRSSNVFLTCLVVFPVPLSYFVVAIRGLARPLQNKHLKGSNLWQ